MLFSREPFIPTKPSLWPLSTTKETFSNTTFSPKFLDTLLDKKLLEKNEGSDIKEFSGLFVNKDIRLKEYGLAGIISKCSFSRINLDLGDATFKQDAFITLTANFSLVDITVPDGYSVSFDGLINRSSVKNAFENTEVKEPVIYIAAKSNYSAIRIFKK